MENVFYDAISPGVNKSRYYISSNDVLVARKISSFPFDNLWLSYGGEGSKRTAHDFASWSLLRVLQLLKTKTKDYGQSEMSLFSPHNIYHNPLQRYRHNRLQERRNTSLTPGIVGSKRKLMQRKLRLVVCEPARHLSRACGSVWIWIIQITSLELRKLGHDASKWMNETKKTTLKIVTPKNLGKFSKIDINDHP